MILQVCSEISDYETKVLQQMVHLSRKAGPLFGWGDNCDLAVSCTPNERRETRCLALQVMCHPAGDILTDIIMDVQSPPLIIPQLKKFEAGNLAMKNLSSFTVQHYTGSKNINPPSLSSTLGLAI